MIDTKPFPFSTDFKTKILALILRDKSFIHKKRHILSHRYFENPVYASVCKIMLDFYDKYGITPTEDSLSQELSKIEDNRLHQKVFKQITNIDLSDAQYVIDEVTDFCTQQATRIALYMCEQYLKDKDYDKILPTMEKALMTKEDSMLNGLRLSESFDVVREYISEDARDEYKIATLIRGMDSILRGGVGPRELHCVFAPTKRGKSILLNNLAYAAVMQTKKVAFISLEMGEKQIATRTHMRLSGMSDEDLDKRLGKWKRAFTRLMSRGGDIYYKQFPTKSLTIKGLDRFLDKLWKVEGFDTDLLIVDYLDIMKGDRNYDDTWKAQGPLAEGLRGLAGDRNLRCWTATQAGKSSGTKPQLTESDVKGDSIKNDTFDSLWSILQTPEEEEAEPPRGAIKNNLLREGKGQGRVIPIIFDKSTMLMTDLNEEGTIPF